MRYGKTLNIWSLSETERAALPIGQWVTAGDDPNAPKGRWMGQKRASDVVAWVGNGKGRWRRYMRDLRAYAKAG